MRKEGIMEKILQVKNLEKSYKKNKAVDGLSFDVYEGEIIGFLGPNGAGKSTTIHMLSTILKPDKGEILYFGKTIKKDLNEIKSSLGIVPQDLAIYDDVSAYKNVKFFASLYGLKGKELEERTLEALRFVGLEERKDDKPKTYSGGMKRRLNIACAIAHHPKILILDEPTVGIDPQSRNHILDSIKTLRKMGTTVIYTTHYMEEVEEIADRIIIMDMGKKIAEGTIKELLTKYKATRVYRFIISNIKSLDEFQYLYDIEGVKEVVQNEDVVKVTTEKQVDNLDKIIIQLTDNGCKIKNIMTEEGNLETVFLNLTGRNLRD